MREILGAKDRRMSSREKPMSSADRGMVDVQTWPQHVAWCGSGMALLLLVAVILLLTSCADPAAIAAVEPTATVYAPPPTDIPLPPPGPTPAALDFPLEAPTDVDVEPVDDETCVGCHSDEDTLRAVASQEEGGQESLSEGEG